MNEILLDTHIALWLGTGDERPRPSTLGLIDDCRRNGGAVLLSAVTAWEIAQLASARRLILDRSVKAWIECLAGYPGVEIIPLTHQAAIVAYQLHDLQHRDPADRLLIATAIERACPLITYDSLIVQFGKAYGSHYGLTIAA